MMVPINPEPQDFEDIEIEEQPIVKEQPIGEKASPFDWLINLSLQQKVLGGVVILSLGSWVMGQGQTVTKTITPDNAPPLTEAIANQSTDPSAQYYLLLNQAKSGALREVAMDFIVKANTFTNEVGHDCQGKSVTVCLGTFEANRATELLALSSAQVSREFKQKRTLEILAELDALEVAYGELGVDRGAIQADYADNLLPAEDSTPPLASLAMALTNRVNFAQTQNQLEREAVEKAIATQSLNQCRGTGEECL